MVGLLTVIDVVTFVG